MLPPSLVEPGRRYAVVGGYTTFPFSRGSIHIASASLTAAPDFDSGYLKAPSDVDILKLYYKFCREVMRRHPSTRGEPAVGHPPFSETSAARLRAPEDFVDKQGISKVMDDIEYSEDDEKVLEEWVRSTVGTSWHPVGTCAMKPRENGGVVDNELNAYGTSGLKIADMSICPEHCEFVSF
jgi:alcohol oxidase